MTNAFDPGKPMIMEGKKFTKLYRCTLTNTANNQCERTPLPVC